MKKRMLTLVSYLILGNCLIVGGGTYALFTASASNTGNNFGNFQSEIISIDTVSQSGVSNIQPRTLLTYHTTCISTYFPMFYDSASYPTGPNPYDVVKFSPSGEIPGGWAPGDAVTRYWFINNKGSSAKFTQISAKLESLTGPTGLISPGMQAYTDFLNHMKVSVYSPEDGYRIPVFCGTFETLVSDNQPLKTVNKPLDTIMYLPKGCTDYKPKFVVSMDLDAGNDLQAVKGVVNFTLSVEQTKHNCFDPPFSNWDYSMKCGSENPIKFECYDPDGNFIKPSKDVKLVICGGNSTHTYSLGNGLSCNGGHFQANVYADKNQFVDGVTYTATVYNGSEICGQKRFTTEPGNRSNSS